MIANCIPACALHYLFTRIVKLLRCPPRDLYLTNLLLPLDAAERSELHIPSAGALEPNDFPMFVHNYRIWRSSGVIADLRRIIRAEEGEWADIDGRIEKPGDILILMNKVLRHLGRQPKDNERKSHTKTQQTYDKIQKPIVRAAL